MKVQNPKGMGPIPLIHFSARSSQSELQSWYFLSGLSEGEMHGAFQTRGFRSIGLEGECLKESIAGGARGLPTCLGAVFAQLMSVGDGSGIYHSLDSRHASPLLAASPKLKSARSSSASAPGELRLTEMGVECQSVSEAPVSEARESVADSDT